MEYSKGPQNDADPNDLEGYTALREGAAIVDRSDRRLLRLTGKDPIGMLNAVLTSDVPTHGDRGAYAMLLDPKGRIQTDLRVVKAGDEILIDTEPEGAEAAKGILARYAPFSRVRLEELPWSVLGLYGPRAREYFGDLEAEHESRQTEIEGRVLLSVGVAVPVPGYDLVGPPEDLAAVRRYLTATGATTRGHRRLRDRPHRSRRPPLRRRHHTRELPWRVGELSGAGHQLREGLLPRPGDGGEDALPRQPEQEALPLRTGARPDGAARGGDEILQGEKKLVGPISSVNVVGWLTSVAPLQVDGKIYALGYLARKADLEAPMRAEDARCSRQSRHEARHAVIRCVPTLYRETFSITTGRAALAVLQAVSGEVF